MDIRKQNLSHLNKFSSKLVSNQQSPVSGPSPLPLDTSSDEIDNESDTFIQLPQSESSLNFTKNLYT